MLWKRCKLWDGRRGGLRASILPRAALHSTRRGGQPCLIQQLERLVVPPSHPCARWASSKRCWRRTGLGAAAAAAAMGKWPCLPKRAITRGIGGCPAAVASAAVGGCCGWIGALSQAQPHSSCCAAAAATVAVAVATAAAGERQHTRVCVICLCNCEKQKQVVCGAALPALHPAEHPWDPADLLPCTSPPLPQPCSYDRGYGGGGG